MQKDLRDRIKAATEASGITKPGFVELLSLIDQHYDKMEATITQSVRTAAHSSTAAPIEAIFDSVTEALLTVASDGIIRNCNKVCTRYFRLTKDQLIGSSIANLLPAAKDQPMANFLDAYTSDLEDTNFDLVDGEVDAVRADGNRFVAEINASSLKTPGGEIYVVSLRDVTDRKQTESALRENEERYRALVENAPEAIIVFDVDNNVFTDANDNACILFNLSRRPSVPRCSPMAHHLLASAGDSLIVRWRAGIRVSNGCTRIRMAGNFPAKSASADYRPITSD